MKLIIQDCDFPKCLKTGIILPKVKNNKESIDMLSNYRPITNISFLSKIVEKVIAQQLTQYLDTNHMLPVVQSAYRRNHSTETALVNIINELLVSADKGQVTLLLTLDQTAAFDVLETEILIKRLQTRFAIQDRALRLLKSYLTCRTVRVRANNNISECRQITCGVPQGSILGPLLYILYTAPLAELVEKHNLKCHFYADDMQLYCVIDNIEHVNIIESCISNIQKWMNNNFLKLNPEKTELIIIGKKNAIKHLPVVNINAEGKLITSTQTLKSLGVILNSTLTMEEFVSQKCQSAGMYLRRLSKVRKCLSFNATHTLLNAFVLGRIDYCNSLLIGISGYLISRLQRVQNWAIRVLFKLSRYDHITFYYTEVHWLPINQRINFKILLLTYKSINGHNPSYLKDLFSSYVPGRDLRSAEGMLLTKPKMLTSIGERAISYQGPLLWNELPDYIKKANSIDNFKKKLKTFLFQKCYC